MATIEQRGPNRWRAIVRRRGKPRLEATYSTKNGALAWARKVEAEMDRGVVPVRPTPRLHEALRELQFRNRQELSRIKAWALDRLI